MKSKHEDAIRALSPVLSQKEIGEALGLSRSCVHKIQKKLGLTWIQRGQRCKLPTAEQEARILELLRAGNGVPRVGGMTGFTEGVVRRVARLNGFRRKRGERGYKGKLDAATENALHQDILAKNGSGVRLAKRHRVSHKRVLKDAHRLLGTKRFKAGCAPPLSSNESQVPRTFERLAEVVLCAITIPPGADAEIICDAVMECVPCLKDAAPEAKEVFAGRLHDALQKQMQPAWVN